MTEKPDERSARHIVSTAMGVPVTRYEDGTADSQVDALIHSVEGPAALEIVGDHESAFNEQWDALEKIGHRVEVPGLRRVWSAQLSRHSIVKDVVRRLPSLVLQLQDELEQGHGPKFRNLPKELTDLGVRTLSPLDDDKQSGHVKLHAQGWEGVAGTEAVGHYVERILAALPDVPSKLASHPTPDKHAFIWTTIGTEYGIQFQLERREQPLPSEAPKLPPGVTHVWVAGSFTSQGVLAWFPDRGWWRPDWS